MNAPSVRFTTAGLVHFEAHDAFTMQPAAARKYADQITRASIDAQRIQDKASGRFEWTASSAFPEVMVDDPTRLYHITHNGTTRLFKRMKVGVSRRRGGFRPASSTPLVCIDCSRINTGKAPLVSCRHVRPPPTHYRWHCEACNVGLPPGTTAYAEATPKPWSNPNWRNVRLCTRCVRTEELGAAIALQGAEVPRG